MKAALLDAIARSPAWFVDTTLRDGAQAAGVAFSPGEQARIARSLAAAGVREMEVGIPSAGEHVRHEIDAVAMAAPEIFRLGWCRARRDDLAAARRCAVHGVHISFPVSDLHLEAWRKPRTWVLETLRDLVGEAAGEFAYVTVGAQDASRADAGFLREFCHAVSESPAIRLRLADTVGVLNPRRTAALVSGAVAALRGRLVEIHAHNDLGMATANTIVAWECGARCLSTTVNGLGERAGNAAFAEVAAALRVACGTAADLDLRELYALSALVAGASRRTVASTMPVVGEDVFTHATGIHLSGLASDARTYEPFAPELVGHAASRRLFGPQSGPRSLARLLGEKSRAIDGTQLQTMSDRLKKYCRETRQALDAGQVVKLARILLPES